MLILVEMKDRLPNDMPAAAADKLKQVERERAQELQRSGVWRHLWRVAGQYANVSILDCADVQQLHDTISSLPLFPYMAIKVTPLCRHPSSIHDDDQ